MRILFLLFSHIGLFFHAFAQADRNWLAGAHSKELLARNLSVEKLDEQFPRYTDRAKWESINPVYRAHLIKDGEEALGFVWKVVPATSYLEFVKSGNRRVMEDVYNTNLTAIRKLAFAELAEGKGRFIPQLINGVWHVCDITSWSISASLNLQKAGAGLPDINEPVIELGTGITVNVMAWTYHLFKDEFDKHSKLISPRIKQEIDRRVLQPFYTRNDFWWMALDGKKRLVNNWNIWLNYNMLTTILLVEDDPAKRADGIYKTMRSADQFINYYKEDGGCEEGPAYWSHAGGMLYNYLSLLQTATKGAVDIFDKPLIRNIGSYYCKAYIDSSWYLNYADAAAKIKGDASLVYHYGKAVKDSQLQYFGSWLARQQQWDTMPPVENMYGGFRNLFTVKEIVDGKAAQPFMAYAWMKETGIAVARDQEGSSKGFYFSALAGHNDESHNHNDVGTCVLYYDGKPFLIDIGSETYTRQTFGPERYTIWTMRSTYHNVPFINGVEQKDGAKYKAKNVSFTNTKTTARFQLDIAAAYPEAAQVKKWDRVYELKRNESFTITDKYQLMANNGNSALHFMTSAVPAKTKEGVVRLVSGITDLRMEFDPKQFDLEIEEVPVKDSRLLESWPPVVYRIQLKIRNKSTEGNHRIVFRKTK
ncbi:heparinase II/III-family protein [Terrimonas sp. NA20]|uniref:Heparinase II/III-family protein n=1 Tax=Terrimonas ginsenosidimutans TaxID=2908004 RepID=A0ABS9KXA6_9BACT|nr:heparinase II/III family protein [Terrimonas ginsenosidimutans]MCG2616951.1 heparinase II/III-family protein [Terrimonas ginsenosidimutans]